MLYSKLGNMNPSRFLLAIVFAILVAGCTTNRPSISAREAKQLAAKFEQLRYVPPPKNGNDILEIVDTTKIDAGMKFNYVRGYTSSESVSEFLNTPSKSLSYVEAVKKGMAFLFIGKFAEARKILDKAYSMGPEGDIGHTLNLMASNIMANIVMGDIVAADKWLGLYGKSVSSPSDLAGFNNRAALLRMFQGRIEEAQSHLRAAENHLADVPRKKSEIHRWAQLYWVKSELELIKGNYAKAEDLLLQAFATYEGSLVGDFGYLPYLQIRWATLKMNQGKPVAAEVLARLALIALLRTQGKDTPLTGMVLSNISRTFLGSGLITSSKR